ncbi:unnamed protein product [Protopolystoma xenopodis]|uniref:Uncharacterized protein n=1 Tax=Protopolystoma xenopodis TaxID=117903 RepID=A0A3S5A186_9PLAT|nr:unnamed protein product [Protopolystoma xenopodis]
MDAVYWWNTLRPNLLALSCTPRGLLTLQRAGLLDDMAECLGSLYTHIADTEVSSGEFSSSLVSLTNGPTSPREDRRRFSPDFFVSQFASFPSGIACLQRIGLNCRHHFNLFWAYLEPIYLSVFHLQAQVSQSLPRLETTPPRTHDLSMQSERQSDRKQERQEEGMKNGGQEKAESDNKLYKNGEIWYRDKAISLMMSGIDLMKQVKLMALRRQATCNPYHWPIEPIDKLALKVLFYLV